MKIGGGFWNLFFVYRGFLAARQFRDHILEAPHKMKLLSAESDECLRTLAESGESLRTLGVRIY